MDPSLLPIAQLVGGNTIKLERNEDYENPKGKLIVLCEKFIKECRKVIATNGTKQGPLRGLSKEELEKEINNTEELIKHLVQGTFRHNMIIDGIFSSVIANVIAYTIIATLTTLGIYLPSVIEASTLSTPIIGGFPGIVRAIYLGKIRVMPILKDKSISYQIKFFLIVLLITTTFDLAYLYSVPLTTVIGTLFENSEIPKKMLEWFIANNFGLIKKLARHLDKEKEL